MCIFLFIVFFWPATDIYICSLICTVPLKWISKYQDLSQLQQYLLLHLIFDRSIVFFLSYQHDLKKNKQHHEYELFVLSVYFSLTITVWWQEAGFLLIWSEAGGFALRMETDRVSWRVRVGILISTKKLSGPTSTVSVLRKRLQKMMWQITYQELILITNIFIKRRDNS